MQPTNHLETPAPPYTTISTSDLLTGLRGTTLGDPVPDDTDDYPEIVLDDSPPARADLVHSDEEALKQPDELGANDETLWEGRPSSTHFLVRLLVGETVTAIWVGLAVATWGFGYVNLTIPTYALGGALLLFWGLTGLKLFRTIHSHHYRLTNRRLFVRTGLLRRRIDQIELLRVKDVFVQQNLLGTWLGVGHVLVISSEQTLPRATLYAIEGPRRVMDLIWLRTRAELDRKTTRIEQV